MKTEQVDFSQATPEIFFKEGVAPSGAMIITFTEMHSAAETGHDKIMELLMDIEPNPDIMLKAGKKVIDGKGQELFLDKYSVYLTLYYPKQTPRLILIDFSSEENATIQ